MAFAYVAWTSWIESGSPRQYVDNTIRFAKKDGTLWTVVEVDNLGDGESYWFTFAQNWGNAFLLTNADWYNDDDPHTDVYYSADKGDTWTPVANNLPHRVRWLDCYNGTWLAMLETGQIAYTTNGASWTVQSATIPDEFDPDDINPSLICLGEDGVIHMVCEDWAGDCGYYTRSGDLGASWSDPVEIMTIANDYGYGIGGIGANEGHVCVVGCYGIWAAARDYVIAQVSHDNGDTWESVRTLQLPALTGWGYVNQRGHSGFVMDAEAAYAISAVEPSTPGKPDIFDTATAYVLHAAKIDYRETGAPPVVDVGYGSYAMGSVTRSGDDGLLCGTMAHGQSRSYAAAFRHYVPVDANCIETTPYADYAAMREMRAYYVDGSSVKTEIVWRGDYPGPHCLESYDEIRDESNQNDDDTIGCIRFSPWRTHTPLLYTNAVAMPDYEGSARGVPMPGDRAAWDVVDYPEIHARDLQDDTPIHHVPTGSATGDAPVWDGDQWVSTDIVTQAEMTAHEEDVDAHHAQLHATSHETGGDDEIDVTDLGGVLADAQTPADHGHTDAVGDGGQFDAANLTSGTAINGQVLMADGLGNAAWDDIDAPTQEDFDAHAARHENGGDDEINVDGLSGVLADRQDADKLQGYDVSTVAPAGGQALVWDAVAMEWQPQAPRLSSHIWEPLIASDLTLVTAASDVIMVEVPYG